MVDTFHQSLQQTPDKTRFMRHVTWHSGNSGHMLSVMPVGQADRWAVNSSPTQGGGAATGRSVQRRPEVRSLPQQARTDGERPSEPKGVQPDSVRPQPGRGLPVQGRRSVQRSRRCGAEQWAILR